MISKPGIIVVILVDSPSFVSNNCEDLLRHSHLLHSFIFSLKFALLYILVLRIQPHPVHFRILSEQCTTLLLPFYQGHPTASQGCCILPHQVPKVSKRPILESLCKAAPFCPVSVHLQKFLGLHLGPLKAQVAHG